MVYIGILKTLEFDLRVYKRQHLSLTKYLPECALSICFYIFCAVEFNQGLAMRV
jgi:hypothetical protein